MVLLTNFANVNDPLREGPTLANRHSTNLEVASCNKGTSFSDYCHTGSIELTLKPFTIVIYVRV